MRILFCCNPLNVKEVDIDYLNEYSVARNLEIDVNLIDFEELVINKNSIKAIRDISPEASRVLAIFRGWMMKPSYYESLYKALQQKNIELINSPYSYKHCHYLPESYSLISQFTPETVWVNKSDIDESFTKIYDALKIFGEAPIIVKDYVKSRKHEWSEACYIPNAIDRDKVKGVVNKFMELQGDDFNEGLVFREFVKLEFLSNHKKSNMPLSKEFRIFFIDGEPAYVVNYWDEGKYDNLQPQIAPFLDVAKKIKSRFFTMDIAKVENDGWTIIELGDGQVSGLPDCADLEAFYKSIKNHIKG